MAGCRAAAIALALLVTACGTGGVAPPDAALQSRPPAGAAWEGPDASTTYARELERRGSDPRPPGRPVGVDAVVAGLRLPRRGPPTPVAAARPGWPPEPPTDGGPLLLPALKLALAWSADGGPDPLRLPIAAAIDRRGDVYVVDAGDGRIRVFDRDGRAARGWGAEGGGDGQFRFAEPRCASLGGTDRCAAEFGGGVAVDGRGRVVVADWGNHRLQVFDRQGRFLAAWGREGSGPGELALPHGVAVDGRGRVVVADSGNHRVQVFDEAGRALARWGVDAIGSGPDGRPAALAADGRGSVYVAHAWGPTAIQRFNPQGRPLAEWAAPEPHGAVAPTVSGLAVDGLGQVWASDTGGGLCLFGPDGRALAVWDIGRPGDGRPGASAGLAADEADAVYVTDRDAGRLHKFRVLLPVTSSAPDGSAPG